MVVSAESPSGGPKIQFPPHADPTDIYSSPKRGSTGTGSS